LPDVVAVEYLGVGLELLLKLATWKVVDGTMRLAYAELVVLGKRYGIEDCAKVFKEVAGAFKKFSDMAIKRGDLPKT
jgi:hypothetical protein